MLVLRILPARGVVSRAWRGIHDSRLFCAFCRMAYQTACEARRFALFLHILCAWRGAGPAWRGACVARVSPPWRHGDRVAFVRAREWPGVGVRVGVVHATRVWQGPSSPATRPSPTGDHAIGPGPVTRIIYDSGLSGLPVVGGAPPPPPRRRNRHLRRGSSIGQ